MPEKRFDFKFEDDEYYAVVIDEEDLGLDVSEFLIYSGSSWAREDELIPTSVYLDNEEGELMFDVHYREYDENGDFWDEKDLTEVPYSQIEYRNFSTTKKKVLEWGLNRIIYVIENTKA
jgi:hypothetical protein